MYIAYVTLSLSLLCNDDPNGTTNIQHTHSKKNRTEILAGSIWFGEFEFEKKVERL